MGLRGDLSELRLVDLIEMMSLGRKTGLLSVYDADGVPAGELAFRTGLLVGATCGRLTGERAFYALLALEQGSFFVDSSVTPTGEHGVPAQSLLMEGMRRLDETRQLRRRIPAGASLRLGQPGTTHDSLEAQIIALLSVQPERVGVVLDRIVATGRADAYECLLAIDRLQARGAVTLTVPPRLVSS